MDLTILQQRQNDCCINPLQTLVTVFDIAMRRSSTPKFQNRDMQMCLAKGRIGFYLKHTGLTGYLRHMHAFKDNCICPSSYNKCKEDHNSINVQTKGSFNTVVCLQHVGKRTQDRQDSFQHSVSAADTPGRKCANFHLSSSQLG